MTYKSVCPRSLAIFIDQLTIQKCTRLLGHTVRSCQAYASKERFFVCVLSFLSYNIIPKLNNFFLNVNKRSCKKSSSTSGLTTKA